ncbi:hypothetical protein [Leptospira kmetyi]|uniref:hypothetical protein n=1 Tax=Leptospira kmetyi TaxID=408139 RepID=UPI000F6477FC|nr:hypothetical protein [Leptospira kmetyi]
MPDGGESIFFGPYTTDLNEPGKYEISFYLKGVGFSTAEEIKQNYLILELDVNEIIERTEIMDHGTDYKILQPATFPQMNTIGKKYIRVNDLISNKNKPFILPITSKGYGIWEYRCFPYDGTDERNDNLAVFEKTVRIFFEKVVIKKVNKFNLPWA